MQESELKAEQNNNRDLQNKYQELEEILQQAKVEKPSLIDILHQVQNLIGYLPREVQIKIARELGIPLSEIYSVVSFYSLFSTEAKGDYNIEVCMGTACYVKGSNDVLDKLKEELEIEPGQVTADGQFSLETARCVGACGMAPVILINGEAHGKVRVEEVPKILAEYKV
ncbi:MAG: NAD(P)H-dependent oxidoreductase subunit E [Bacillota bacterium]